MLHFSPFSAHLEAPGLAVAPTAPESRVRTVAAAQLTATSTRPATARAEMSAPSGGLVLLATKVGIAAL
jgi:hypothetical protein